MRASLGTPALVEWEIGVDRPPSAKRERVRPRGSSNKRSLRGQKRDDGFVPDGIGTDLNAKMIRGARFTV